MSMISRSRRLNVWSRFIARLRMSAGFPAGAGKLAAITEAGQRPVARPVRVPTSAARGATSACLLRPQPSEDSRRDGRVDRAVDAVAQRRAPVALVPDRLLEHRDPLAHECGGAGEAENL